MQGIAKAVQKHLRRKQPTKNSATTSRRSVTGNSFKYFTAFTFYSLYVLCECGHNPFVPAQNGCKHATLAHRSTAAHGSEIAAFIAAEADASVLLMLGQHKSLRMCRERGEDVGGRHLGAREGCLGRSDHGGRQAGSRRCGWDLTLVLDPNPFNWAVQSSLRLFWSSWLLAQICCFPLPHGSICNVLP